METGRPYKLAAFANSPDGGNPAGVWIEERFPDDGFMQGIAAEIGFSETAFVILTGLRTLFSGRYNEAFQAIKAIRLDPKGPYYYYLVLGHICRGSGQYDDAIVEYKKTIERQPNYWIAHAFLAAVCNLTDREEEARAEAAEVLRIDPRISLDK